MKTLKRVFTALAAIGCFGTVMAATQTYNDFVPSSTPVTVFTNVSLSEIGTKYALGATFGGAWMQAGEAFPMTFSRTENSLTVEFRRIDDASSPTYVKAIPVTFTQNGNDIQAVAGTPKYITSQYLSATPSEAQNSVDSNGNPVYRVSSLTLIPKTESINISFTHNNATITDASLISGVGQYAIAGTKWDTFGGFSSNNTGSFIGDNGGVYKLGLDGEKTAVEGANVKVENSSGSWYCTYNDSNAPNITGATYFMWGYIDDNSNYLLPKITVTGVPFDRYRVITYFSTDTLNRKFGPLTINDTVSLMGNSEKTATITGSDFWGAADWKGPLQEGKNYLVSPTLSGATATIQGKANSSQANGRAGIAAISIVEAVKVEIEVEDGVTYTLDLDAALAEADYVKFVCNGSFTLEGKEGRVITESDILNSVDLTGVDGTVTLGANTCYALGADRALPGGKIMFGEGSAVAITETMEEYGKGNFSVSGLTGVSKVILTRVTGEKETIQVTDGTASLAGAVVVSGKACWIDYEMAYGNGKTGFENTGTSSLALQEDSYISGSNAFTDDGMLYTYAHPYRQNLTMPSTWTAVVRCTVPNYPDAAVITFGWNNNYIGLVAGETPKTEMRLVQYKTGYENNHYVTNAVMTVQDATTAQHVYIFAVENSQTLKVYCDGSKILDKVLDESLTITSGFQIGSVLGGAAGGIVRFAKNESPANTLSESVQKDARIDCVRLYDYSLSADQLTALSDEFPAVKLYEATVAANADMTWEALDWSNDWDGGNEYSKVLLTVEGDATIALPESITAEELAFEVEPGSTLTLKGPGSLAVTRAIGAVGFTLKLEGAVTLAADTTFAGSVVFASDFEKAGNGAIKIANGATIGVDEALVVTTLGAYTCAEGTVVDASYDGEGVRFMPLADAVAKVGNGYYPTLDSAVAALGSDAGTLTLLADTESTITLNVGQTLVAGEFTVGEIAIAEGVATGYEVRTVDGTSTLVDNTASTWAGSEGADWSTAGNWSTGLAPKAYTVVTFNDGASVTLDANASVAGVVVNGAVAITASAKSLNTSGDVTGEGTLTLSDVCLASTAADGITVGENVAVNFTNDSELAKSGEDSQGVTFNGDVTISGSFKVWNVQHTMNGAVTFNSGASLTYGALLLINGDATVKGAITRAGGGSCVKFCGAVVIEAGNLSIDGWQAGNLDANATVVLAGAEATLTDSRGSKIDLSKVSTTVEDCEVVQNGNVYSVAQKPVITIAETEHGTVTVKQGEDTIVSGDRVARGTTVTITLTPVEGYKIDDVTVVMGGVDITETLEPEETGDVATADVTITADTTVTVTFAAKAVSFTVAAVPNTTVKVMEGENEVELENGVYTVQAGAQVKVIWVAADGYIVTTGETDWFTPTANQPVAAPEGMKVEEIVAKIGDTPYTSLQAAIDAATEATQETEGDTITLLKAVPDALVLEKAVTIDTNGYNAFGAGLDITVDGGYVIMTEMTEVNKTANTTWVVEVLEPEATPRRVKYGYGVRRTVKIAYLSGNCFLKVETGDLVKEVPEAEVPQSETAGKYFYVKDGEDISFKVAPFSAGTILDSVTIGETTLTKTSTTEEDFGMYGKYTAYGYTATEIGADTVINVNTGTAKAQVGDTPYLTLEAAIEAAGTTASTVKLLENITEQAVIAAGQTITLDLDGKSITVAGGFAVINNGTLTITGNGAISGKYAIRGTSNSITTIENGNFTAQECAVSTAKNITNATFVINGGTYTTVDNSVLSGNGSENSGGNTWTINGGTFNGGITSANYIACGIYAPNADTWTINGGTFNVTGGCGILARAGNVTIPSTSTVTITTSGTTEGWVGDKKAPVPCAAILFDTKNPSYPAYTTAASIVVAGGTFTSNVAAVQQVMKDGDTIAIAISGGSYSSDVKAFCVSGKTTKAETGMWGTRYIIVDAGIDPADANSKQEVAVEVDTTGMSDKEAQAAVEAAAVAAASVEIPSDVAAAMAAMALTIPEATYKGYFSYTVTATATSGVYEVKIADLNKEVVFPTEEAATETADLAEVLDVAAETPVEITTAKPGLYYSIEAATDLGFTEPEEGDRTLATGTTVSPKKPAVTGTPTAVFYRVKVSATPNN